MSMAGSTSSTPTPRDQTEHVEAVEEQHIEVELEPHADNSNLAEGDRIVDESKEKSKKLKSFVWDHFPYMEGAVRAPCKYCGTYIGCNSSSSGTAAMGNHLKKYCVKSPLYKKPNKDKRQKTLECAVKKAEEVSGSGGSMTSYSFNQIKCRKKLAEMCIKDNIPFRVVDGSGFQEFCWELNPKFKPPSRWTVARDCLRSFRDECLQIKKLIKNQRLCLTTDCWTSIQNINYICLTGHWIDDEWRLQKRVLNFCPISNHKGVTIGRMVECCLNGWGVEKIFTLTVDNASSNDGAIRYLKGKLKGPDSILDCKYLHLRCCAHILNLIVKDGLEEQHDSIAKIRNVVRYVRSSPARLQKFKYCVEKEKIKCDKLVCLDVDTRWNSTYLMLEAAEKFENAFNRLEIEDGNYVVHFASLDEDPNDEHSRRRRGREKMLGCPDEKDWENARVFLKFLKLFYDVTLKISGSSYITSNMFFNELMKIHVRLKKLCSSDDLALSSMAYKMRLKYDKYWENLENINFLLYIAVILDPRDKLVYVEFCFAKIYGTGSEKAKDMTAAVLSTLQDLYTCYKSKFENSSAIGNSFVSYSNMDVDNDDSDFENEFESHMVERHGGGCRSEIDVYLSDAIEKRDEQFDVLGWWKTNSNKFPILSLIARHVLAMPISTVASESAFSTSGRVLDQFRSSLSPVTVEALICTQDWLRSRSSSIDIMEALENIEDLETIEKEEFQGTNKSMEHLLLDY